MLVFFFIRTFLWIYKCNLLLLLSRVLHCLGNFYGCTKYKFVMPVFFYAGQTSYGRVCKLSKSLRASVFKRFVIRTTPSCNANKKAYQADQWPILMYSSLANINLLLEHNVVLLLQGVELWGKPNASCETRTVIKRFEWIYVSSNPAVKLF